MELLYANEHTSCKNFVSKENIGFKYLELSSNEKISFDNHNNDCSVFLLDGKISIDFFKGRYKAELSLDDMCLIPQNWINEVTAIENCKLIVLMWNRVERLCDKVFLEELPLTSTPRETGVHVVKQNSFIRDVLSQVKNYLDIGLGCIHMHRMKQEELLLIMRSVYTKEEAAKFFAGTMIVGNEFVRFVLNNYKKVKSVKELAGLYFGSIRSFNRKFLENFNESPYRWMTKKKSEDILEHISDVRFNMQEIAYKFGFSSASHFTRFFVQTFGETPSKMRQRLVKERKAS